MPVSTRAATSAREWSSALQLVGDGLRPALRPQLLAEPDDRVLPPVRGRGAGRAGGAIAAAALVGGWLRCGSRARSISRDGLSERPAPRVPLDWDVGSSVFDTATIAGLRANLHELAADVHELAAAVHDLRAEEHAQALLHSLGDPGLHQLWADLRRTAAAAEWASARKERHAAEQLRRSPAS